MKKFLFVLSVAILLFSSCKKEKPEASFTLSPLSEEGKCIVGVGESANFTNQSKNADAYEWYFGDGNTSTEENPTHTYTEVGTYWVSLIASNSGGLSQAWGTVYVEEEPEGLVIRIYNYAYDTIPYPWPADAFVENCSIWLYENQADYLDLNDNYTYFAITDAKGRIVYENFKANQKYYLFAYKGLTSGYLTNIGLYTNLETKEPKKQLELYLFPVQKVDYTTDLELTVYEEGTITTIPSCSVWLFDNLTDMQNENISDTIASGITDIYGKVTFTNLNPTTYYYLLKKESGSGNYTNNLSGMDNSTATLEEYQLNYCTGYVRYVEPFITTFKNKTYTDIDITINGLTKTAIPEGSVSFTFTSNPGSYSYYAETYGKTYGGTQIGEILTWNYTHYVSLYSSYETDLNIGSDYFFMYMQNYGSITLGPIEVVNSTPYYYRYENVSIPNDNVQYSMGYYPAYTGLIVYGSYLGSRYVYWEEGIHFSYPGVTNQSINFENSIKKSNILAMNIKKVPLFETPENLLIGVKPTQKSKRSMNVDVAKCVKNLN